MPSPRRFFRSHTSLGRCVSWKMRPLDDVSLGRCVPWTMCPLDDVSLGRHVPWTTCPLDDASLTDVPWPWTINRLWIITTATQRNLGYALDAPVASQSPLSCSVILSSTICTLLPIRPKGKRALSLISVLPSLAGGDWGGIVNVQFGSW